MQTRTRKSIVAASLGLAFMAGSAMQTFGQATSTVTWASTGAGVQNMNLAGNWSPGNIPSSVILARFIGSSGSNKSPGISGFATHAATLRFDSTVATGDGFTVSALTSAATCEFRLRPYDGFVVNNDNDKQTINGTVRGYTVAAGNLSGAFIVTNWANGGDIHYAAAEMPTGSTNAVINGNGANILFLTESGKTITVGNTGVRGIVSTVAGVIKAGPGKLILQGTGANFIGSSGSGITNQAGTIAIGKANALGGQGARVYLDGGDIEGLGNFTVANPVTMSTDATIFGAPASGEYQLLFSATGAGAIDATAGTLTIRNTGAAGSTFAAAFNGRAMTVPQPIVVGDAGDLGAAQLRFAQSATGTAPIFSGDISGPGSVKRVQTGTARDVVLTGNNTYTGGTILEGGYLGIGHDNALSTGAITFGNNSIATGLFASGAPRTLNNNIVLDSGTAIIVVKGADPITLTGGVAVNAARTIQLSGATSLLNLNGALTGSSALLKNGAGTLVLGGDSSATFSGDIMVEHGTLLVNGNSGTGTITAITNVTGGQRGILGGSGTVAAVTIADGGTVSPGTSPGTLTSGNQVWQDGGSYTWELNDVDAIGGQDLLNINGTLDIQATTVGTKFVIDITSLDLSNAPGAVHDFTTSSTYSWTIATASGGIVGFDADKFIISTANFSNPIGVGTFSLSVVGNDLVLSFTSAPYITAQPVNDYVPAGQVGGFSVAAGGSAPLSYQWKKDGLDISGATDATLVINNAQLADQGSYTVYISNAYGNVTSDAATLTIIEAVAITSQPTGGVVASGGDITFSVTATGEAPLAYQWKKDGNDISGATDSSYTINPVTGASAGSYTVLVSNSGSSELSSAAVLNVSPTITSEPGSLTQDAGTLATFTVVADGEATLSYQWSKDGTPLTDGGDISGATSATLSIATVLGADEGSYTVVVSNGSGSDTSAAATLTVNDPVINVGPGSLTKNAGEDATFTVTATGTEPLSYQWKKDGSAIGTATDSSYTIVGVAQADAASYTVEVSNSEGSVESAAATLTVIDPPVITTQPATQSVGTGSNAVFTVVFTGTAPTFVWKKDGVTLVDGGKVSGATTATLTLAGVETTDNGDYTVELSNAAGNASSTAATLTVFDPPVITTQPENQVEALGGTANFSVVATGTSVAYQWKKEGVNLSNGGRISGADSATLTITTLEVADNGNYTVEVSNIAGTVTSDTVTLTVTAAPVITGQPASITVNAGELAEFTVVATGAEPLAYQWRKDGVDITDATNSTYSIAAATQSDAASYTVYVSNTEGNATSDAATLTVIDPPVITTQPASLAVGTGSNAVFTVEFTGTSPAIQWQKAGVDLVDAIDEISGATTATLTIHGADAADAGDYTVVLSNAANTNTSSIATLTVVDKPIITTQPASQTGATGGNVTFTVEASGTAPFVYQWSKDGSPIGGATESALTLTGLSLADEGSYTVDVSNVAGNELSSAAVLTVIDGPTITTQPVGATLDEGNPVSFTVDATGPSLSYQWKKDGSDISGATDTSYSIAAVTFADRGDYTVVVSNPAASVTSDVAALVVNAAPVITAQPVSQSVALGSPATFSVSVDGYPLNYQWSFNGAEISGATESAYTIASVASSDLGYYSVRISNVLGTVDSTEASLSTTSGTVVFYDDFESGTMSNWSVLAGAGLANSGAQNAEPVAGTRSAKINANGDRSHRNIHADNGGTELTGHFRVGWHFYDDPGDTRSWGELRSYNGTGIANGASSTANGLQNIIAMAKYNSVTLPGDSAFNGTKYQARAGFSTNAAAFQWFNLDGPGSPNRSAGWHYFEIERLSDNTTVNFYIDGILARSVTGVLSFGIDNVVLGGGLSTSTGTFIDGVKVQRMPQAPSISTQPAALAKNAGESATFSVVAGPDITSYQWLKNGAAISGATESAYTINSVLKADEGSYSVIAVNAQGPITSDEAALTVVDPAINTQPANAEVGQGTNAVFTVVASGTGISYAWFKDGNPLSDGGNISGATTDSLTVAGVTALDVGVYTVVVTGTYDTVTSPGATLTVGTAPVITDQPDSIASLNQGMSASFTVAATGTAPLSYQWNKDGNPVSGATDATYTISATSTNDAGSYTVLVSNPYGAELSAAATLSIIPDTTDPVIAITYPKGTVYTTNIASIDGTAKDLVGISQVLYSLNGSAFAPANLTYVGVGKPTNWTISASATPGTNIVVAKAIDLAGNETAPKVVKFYYHVQSLFTYSITDEGNPGTITAIGSASMGYTTNNAQLFVGRTYKIKSQVGAGTNSVLTNITYTAENESGVIFTNTAALPTVLLNFTMKTNLHLTFNYINNPLNVHGGTFYGLFSDKTNGLSHHSSGYAQIKVTSKFTYSAKIIIDGNTVGFGGKLPIDGKLIDRIVSRYKATEKGDLKVSFDVDMTGQDKITGSISEVTNTWVAELEADRMVWSLSNEATTWTNAYTAIVPGFTNKADGPVGSTYGNLSVDLKGKAKWIGGAGDYEVKGSPVVAVTYLSKDGYWPFYAPMYKAKRALARLNALGQPVLVTEYNGAMMGWLQLTTNNLGNLRPEGEVSWIKTGLTNILYAGGFTNLHVPVIASRWLPATAAGQYPLDSTTTNWNLTFTEGNLSSPYVAATLLYTNKLVAVKDLVNKPAAALAPKTGLIKGTFLHPSNPSVATKWFGVALQDMNIGEGWFVGPSEGGKMEFAPAPPAP